MDGREAPLRTGSLGNLPRPDRDGSPSKQHLEKLGCRLARNGLGQLAFEVGDPLGFRKQVESHLRKHPAVTKELASQVLEGIRTSLEFCEAALRPLVPTKPGHVETGDTLSRVLLSVPVLQEPFGVSLLQLIPGLLESGDETSALTVLGQFKWLESVDPGAGQEIIRALCSLLADAACTGDIRAAVASLLPELASVSDTELLVDTLLDPSRRIPTSSITEALPLLELTSNLQEHALERALYLMRQMQAEPREMERVALFQFLLGFAANEAQLARLLSCGAEEINPSRYCSDATPGEQHGGGDVTEGLMGVLSRALQWNGGLPAAIFRHRLHATASPRTLDAWWAFALCAMGDPHSKKTRTAVARLLATATAVERSPFIVSIEGQADALRSTLGTLLDLCKALMTSASPAVVRAGVAFITTIVLEFSFDQVVLATLHSMLCTGNEHVVRAAVAVLNGLAEKAPAQLAKEQNFLGQLLLALSVTPKSSRRPACRAVARLLVLPEAATPTAWLFDKVSKHVQEGLDSIDEAEEQTALLLGIESVRVLADRELIQVQGQETVVAARKLLQGLMDACRSPSVFLALCKEFVKTEPELDSMTLCCLSTDTQQTMSPIASLHPTLLGDLAQLLMSFLDATFVVDAPQSSGGEHTTISFQLGDGFLTGHAWWDLDGGASGIAIALLPLLCKELVVEGNDSGNHPTVVHSARLPCLAPALRLLAAIETVRGDGSLAAVDALLGAPLLLPVQDYYRRDKLPSETLPRQALCLALFYALEWSLALIDAFEPSVRGDMPSEKAKILARIEGARQLDQALARLLSQVPEAVLILHRDCTTKKRPSAAAKSGQVAKRRNISSSATTEAEGDPRSPAREEDDAGPEQATIEQVETSPSAVPTTDHSSMTLDSLVPFGILTPLSFTSLRRLLSMYSIKQAPGAVSYLLHSLLLLKTTGSAKRRAGSVNQRWADLLKEDWAVDGPLLRKHLDVALDCCSSSSEEPSGAINVLSNTSPGLLQDVEVDATAQRAVNDCLEMARMTMAAFDLTDSAALTGFFVSWWSGSEAETGHSVHESARVTFDYFKDRCLPRWLISGEESHGDPSQTQRAHTTADVSVGQVLQAWRTLCILDSLRSVSETVGSEGEDSRMRSALAAAARTLLRDPGVWQAVEAGPIRQQVTTDVMKIMLAGESRSHRIQQLVELASTVLVAVTSTRFNKQAVPEWPSVSGTTFALWYRTLFQALQVEWKALCLAPEEDQNRMEEDQPTKAELQQECARCFVALLSLLQVQSHRPQVLTTGAQAGIKFLESFFKLIPYWKERMAGDEHAQNTFTQMIKTIQKGTRLLQTLCIESKIQRQTSVTSKVPQLKKTLEKFVFQIKFVFANLGLAKAFWLGALKHKDLQGREVSSQMYPEDDRESEGEEEEEPTDDTEQHD